MTTIAILGTGNLATALGTRWVQAGNDVAVAGRTLARARRCAAAIGGRAVEPAEVRLADVVVLAVSPGGVEEALGLVDAPSGALRGLPLVDCTNAVDYATGRLVVDRGSFAEQVSGWAPGAHVVKALHLFAGTSWLAGAADQTVAICGDDPAALEVTGRLVADLGGTAAVVGGLDAARQLEEAAGFVMRVAAAGHNPRTAVPDVPAR